MRWMTLLLLLSFKLHAQQPALIPQPQTLQWQQGAFPLTKAVNIYFDTTFAGTAGYLQQWLQGKGINAVLLAGVADNGTGISLKKNKNITNSEGYTLRVTPAIIVITAATDHGMFNGSSTLRQLLLGDGFAACEITDNPAFPWRGYMVDVGRNYQSMPLLKQQIDKMADYKLNVFQFHFTEDIAWRWQVPGFPALTADSNIIRNKGKYYTSADIHELIRYCADRHILFVPEIDMPGHSAAFKRAMGFDMQSDSGMHYLRQIVTLFIKEFNLPFLHIGGDEVKITNKTFLPEMIRMINEQGVQTIGWDPGGNIPASTIHQLWMRDAPATANTRYLDSRHLYLNHMDPLESVTTIFQRRIGDRLKADQNVLGGIICLWHDRKVATEKDLLTMNPVYPAMLAFAERSWHGGGTDGWKANLDVHDPAMMKEFNDFEKRLLTHQQLYFKGLPFAYQPQQTKWKLTGTDKRGKVILTLPAQGGTVVLQHFWHPLVKGLLPEGADTLQWTATASFYADQDTLLPVWIGFNNLSRSYFSDSPEAGMWDNKGSNVTVNGLPMAPPQWQHAGHKGKGEFPLTDEGYEYRSPAMVPFHKGANEVVMYLPRPVAKSADWQNPVKWMYTFVPLQQPAFALSDYFTDHMVLQRDKPMQIFGTGLPGTALRVRFGNRSVVAKVQADGSWMAVLPAFAADTVAKVLSVTDGKRVISCYDVLVGDVWVCAGQSNMEFTLAEEAHVKEAAPNKQLRLMQRQKNTSTYNVPYQVSDTIFLHPANYYSGSWKVADIAAARPFSAVGFYFGEMLQHTLHVPVGLINVAVGGSPCEAWIREAAGKESSVKAVFSGNWLSNPALEPWCIQRGHENLDTLLAMKVPLPANATGYRHPFQPGFLYDAAIAPLTAMQVKGIIWYQGESNALSEPRVQQHGQLFPLMVADWRAQWHSPELPFYFCQLSGISTEKGYKSAYWPLFRAQQLRLSDSIPFSGMAVTSDVGHPTDVHPTDKQTVGRRLARVALARTYGYGILYKGPVPEKAILQGDTAYLSFNKGEQITTADHQPLRGFTLKNGNKLTGMISGNVIKLPVPAGTSVIYYGWSPFTDANLVNEDELPASTMEIVLQK
ncbi:N-acetyl-beta-hexosaminidase [Chitinophaga jiangningensis]|uniref:N-acetyl-beta-hexosaminidase n=1 Tax=Chitinophaga jiangningensis TaxID=1419482 RepID=A0A1M7M2W0_9BACT|nr:family 20 glycosylhydrolase [Chitinophaga jiangningensis]SHM84865.1 N-acetyl-beta-hexosaminidase [Chitinophaga jiangningensis]